MASRLSSKPELTTPASGDYLPIIDVSDLSSGSTGTSKKITKSNLQASITGLTSAPYFLVAANNAPTNVKNRADYVCDGTADEVEINAALTALNGVGGKIQLSQGNFTLGSSIVVVHGSTDLVGTGWGTIITAKNALNTDLISFQPNGGDYVNGFYIGHMKIDCNGANQSGGDGIYAHGAVWCEFEDLWMVSPYNNAIHLYQDNLGSYGHHNKVHHCFVEKGNLTSTGDGRAILLDQSDENMITDNVFQDNGRSGATEPNHVYDKAGLNSFIGNQFVSGQTGLKLQGPHNKAIGNTFDGCANNQMRLNGEKNLVHGNVFHLIGANTTTNTTVGIFVDNVSQSVITGNLFNNAASSPVAKAAIDLSSGPAVNTTIAYNIFATNGSTTPYASNYGTSQIILGTGTGHNIHDNIGLTRAQEMTTVQMKNTSGGSLSQGSVVVMKGVANGDEVNTTTSGGDSKVYGMIADSSIANNAYGNVQILGKTIYLKVDGTTDIAIGDFISTFTSAGIAKKAGSGDMAFAVALEAYTNNDSNGVIDAILITPRKV